MMTNEQIERLTMDLTCGQMNEDTEALFRTYLGEHPEHKKVADGFGELCLVCEQGMGSEELPLRSPEFESKPKQKLFARPLLLNVYARAAILLLAVFLGFGIGRLNDRQTTGPQHVQTSSGRTADALAGRLEAEEGFWQEKIDELRKPKLWAMRNRTDKNETFWGRYRKELNNVQSEN